MFASAFLLAAWSSLSSSVDAFGTVVPTLIAPFDVAVRKSPSPFVRFASTDDGTDDDDGPPVPPTAAERLDDMKRSLVRACERTSPDKNTVLGLVRDVEEMGEQVGVGQGTAVSGLMAGKWSLVYASEDATRSSPFFWAFRKTFPENAEQIFSVTDAIPAPIKEVGPATQTISEKDGTLVSRVKVATLGGVATSIMTTRCTILGADGLDTLRIRVDTTKPEKSTILQKLGPLGTFLDESAIARPFPSGEALERVRTGGSEVRVETTFCDEGLRISRDADSTKGGEDKDFYVWVRDTFESDADV